MKRLAAMIPLALLIVAGERADGRPAAPPKIEAVGMLSPRVALFGDTVRARVDVTLDRSGVDPGSVRVAADFSPWVRVSEPDAERRDGKTTTYLRTTFVLRCLSSACAPAQGPLSLEFDPATVTYAAPARRKLVVDWPVLEVHSRLDRTASDAQAGPWRAELVSMPAVSYRVAPGAALAVFLTAGVLLGIAGLALGSRVLPRRRPKPAPQAEDPRKPALTPMEHALALLENPAADGAADRRRALEFVAAELAGSGDEELAQGARELAWSEENPAAEEARGLAARVRSVLGGGKDG